MIKFQAIKNAGLLDRERLVFNVTESGNIGKCMVHCTRSRSGPEGRRLTNKIFDSYWFADQPVEEGDLAVLYTKTSASNYKLKPAAAGGKNTHFFYWQKDKAVWDQNEVAVVWGQFVKWETHQVETDEDSDDLEPATNG